MSILFKIWEKTVGKITVHFDHPDPDFYYFDYALLDHAVQPMPNPHKILPGHEETAYKWSKMSQWVTRTVTPTNEENAIFGQMGDSLFAISRAIQSQKDTQTIKIPKNEWNNFDNRLPFLLESITFYNRKPLDDPKVTFLRSADRHTVAGTNIPIPPEDKSFPDKAAYIRHFYKTIAESRINAPSRSIDTGIKP